MALVNRFFLSLSESYWCPYSTYVVLDLEGGGGVELTHLLESC